LFDIGRETVLAVSSENKIYTYELLTSIKHFNNYVCVLSRLPLGVPMVNVTVEPESLIMFTMSPCDKLVMFVLLTART